METIDVGFLSLLPPIIAIALALCTKEVISSLLIGILSGGLIYALNTGGGIIEMSSVAFGVTAETVGSPGKFNIILFLALLGALVYVVTMAGGSRAYGNWASTKLKSKRSAQLATSFLGMLIFIDDYFNCLTVGIPRKAGLYHRRHRGAGVYHRPDLKLGGGCRVNPVRNRRLHQ